MNLESMHITNEALTKQNNFIDHMISLVLAV
jgi:hypothetical protein